uniref:Uncharacterized protein n=1 Tax=Globodera rostochiensis TaxID=31243 RepID=A0A914I6R4_GLORO
MNRCYSLFSSALLLISLLAVGVGAFWPYAGGQPVDATTVMDAPAQSAAADDDASATSGDGQQPAVQSSSFHELTLVNNGCVYHNGMITDNGGQPRKATAEEEAKVQEYLSASQRQQQQFQQSMAEQMRRVFAPPFPFGQNAAAWQFPQFPQFPRAQMVETPCFCENCRNATSMVQGMSSSMGQGNTANAYNQYSVVGGQQQQEGTK